MSTGRSTEQRLRQGRNGIEVEMTLKPVSMTAPRRGRDSVQVGPLRVRGRQPVAAGPARRGRAVITGAPGGSAGRDQRASVDADVIARVLADIGFSAWGHYGLWLVEFGAVCVDGPGG